MRTKLLFAIALGAASSVLAQDYDNGKRITPVRSYTPSSFTSGRRLGDSISMSSALPLTNGIYTAPDGTAWQRVVGMTVPYSSAYAEYATTFNLAIIGAMLNAPDGTTNWTYVASSLSNVHPVVGTSSLWLMSTSVTTNNIYYTSADQGQTWTARTAPYTAGKNWFPNWNGTQFVLYAPSSTTSYTSTDGISWTSRTCISLASVTDITYANSLYVVTGSATAFATSPDGVTWTSRTAPTAFSFNSNFSGTGAITYNSGLAMWFGTTGTTTANQISYLTSADGITWTARFLPLALSTGSANQIKFASNGTTTISIDASGKYASSTDGINWTTSFLDAEFPAGSGTTPGFFWWDGSRYILIFGPWGIYTSSNGTTWTRRRLAGARDLSYTAQPLPLGGSAILHKTGANGAFWIAISDLTATTPTFLLPSSTVNGGYQNSYVRIK